MGLVRASQRMSSTLARCPNLERTCALGFALSSPDAPCGLLAASFFVKSKTQGKPTELERWMLDDDERRPSSSAWRLASWAAITDEIAHIVWSKKSWMLESVVPGMKRQRDRSWLARAVLEAFRHSPELATALRYATLELESESRALLVGNPKGVERIAEKIGDVDQRLSGVTVHGLREEGFGTFFTGVLFAAQLTYVAFRLAGFEHPEAWAMTIDRLEAPHPIGDGETVGRWLISKLRIAVRNHDKKVRIIRRQDPHTVARTLLIAVEHGAGAFWPWRSPSAEQVLFPAVDSDLIAGVISQTLTIVSQWRRNQGQGARANEYFTRLPKAYEDAAKIVLEVASARDPEVADRGSRSFEQGRCLARATLKKCSVADRQRIAAGLSISPGETEVLLGRARENLPPFLEWLGAAIDELVQKHEEEAR